MRMINKNVEKKKNTVYSLFILSSTICSPYKHKYL